MGGHNLLFMILKIIFKLNCFFTLLQPGCQEVNAEDRNAALARKELVEVRLDNMF